MKNRYRADIKCRRDMKICALLIVAFLVLVYSVGAREEMPPTLAQRGWCISCHHTPMAAIRDYGTYRRIMQGKATKKDEKAVAALNEQIRLARLITE